VIGGGLMSVRRSQGLWTLRFGALALVASAFVLGPAPAGAYYYHLSGPTIIRWGPNPTSPPTIWNDAAQTLTWHFNPVNFPQPTWPSIAQAGAAFENSYKTIQDTLGTNLQIVRGPNSTGGPMINDGRLDMCMTHDENNDVFGNNIAGAFAVTYVSSSGASLTDADVEINGDPNSFPNWATTGPPAPPNSNDIETTSCHEQLHTIGAGHPIYFYAMVWPQGRVPELLQYDRCLSPDDRMVIRTLYPAAPAFATINGTVTLSGGGPVSEAVVVATDASGIPQATWVADVNGVYSINVPAGTYTVNAHHHRNSTYNSDIGFGAATGFLTVPAPPTTAALAAGGMANNVNLVATAGTATMTLTRLGMNGAGLNSQVLFLPKGSSGTMQLEITCNPSFTAAQIAGLTLSSNADIAVNSVNSATSPGNGTTVVDLNYSVAAGAVAGVRNITLTLTSGERLFLPAYLEVLDTGTLTVAASAGNPAAGTPAPGSVDQPLLDVALTASAVEDIRLHGLQFNIAGTGPTLPAVRLWIDQGTLGAVDAGDVRVFTGNAYASNPVAETTPLTPPATILFDQIALTVPAGQTVHLLLTADMPGAGSGDYAASFDPTVAGNIEAHGMFWGDVYTSAVIPQNGAIAGGAVTGGTQTVGTLAIGNLEQIQTTAGTPIPVGGSTPESQVTLRGTSTAPVGTVGMDVEIQPVGTAFTNTPNGPAYSSSTTNPSGTQIALVLPGLSSGVAYHWQARATGSAGGPSAWVSFGANAESAADFTVDTSTTLAPNPLNQFESDGTTAMPLGGSTRGQAVLAGTAGSNNQGLPVRLEVEVQPAGTPFTGIPQVLSAFVTGGTTVQVSFAGPANDYHWQARCATAFGSQSAFTVFSPAPVHFHLDPIQTITANAGCIGRASGSPDGSWALCWAAGAAVVALACRRRPGRRSGGTLVLLVCLGAAAQAAEDPPLPPSLAYALPAGPPAPERFGPGAPDALLEPGSTKAPAPPFMTLDAYLGMLFMNFDFEATGADAVNRKVKGIGTGVLGVEALVDVLPDCRLGFVGETALWSDLRVFSGGPEISWEFSGSPRGAPGGRLDPEHYVKLALSYEKLTVSKNMFGSFDPTFGVRLGYELRLPLGDQWSLTVDAAVQYSRWTYSPSILGGDDRIGGVGGLISVGVAWLP